MRSSGDRGTRPTLGAVTTEVVSGFKNRAGCKGCGVVWGTDAVEMIGLCAGCVFLYRTVASSCLQGALCPAENGAGPEVWPDVKESRAKRR